VSRGITRLLNGAKPPRGSAWEELARRVASAPARRVPGAPDDNIVHDYAFAAVSERDGRGRFRFRGRFFSLSDEGLRLYHRLDAAYLRDLVRSLDLDR
jgi:hypothetical protein